MRWNNTQIVLFFILLLGKSVFAQQHDANWVLSTGYDSINNNTLVYFPPGGQPQVSLTTGYIPFAYTNTNISDSAGNLLIITKSPPSKLQNFA